MQYPAFFDKVRPIVLHDPLAEFLAAAENGPVERILIEHADDPALVVVRAAGPGG